MPSCVRHYEEAAVAACRTCKRAFCGRCVVYSFGPRKPPFCVGCALAASGVRSGVKQQAVPEGPAMAFEKPPRPNRKEERDQKRLAKVEAKAARKAAKAAARSGLTPQPHADVDPAHPTVLAGFEHIDAPWPTSVRQESEAQKV